MFLAMGPGGILGAQIFLKKVFKQTFCGQYEENISNHVTKIITQVMHWLTKQIESLGLIYC